MNELKFRAWTGTEMVYGVQPFVGAKNVCMALDVGFNIVEPTGRKRFWYEVEVKDIMQFTGIKDRNDKELYEGDVVRVKVSGVGYEIFTLVWQMDRMRFGLRDEEQKDFEDSWAFTYNEDFEIIGNIYEPMESIHHD